QDVYFDDWDLSFFTYIELKKNDSHTLFSSRVKVSVLFNHNQNDFTLSLEGSSFADYDLDGLTDQLDPFPQGSDPLLDTDNDGIVDNEDLDDDNDGVPDEQELIDGTDPLDSSSFKDSDNDGTPDAIDNDIDGDGLPNKIEENYGLDPFDPEDAIMDFDGDGLTNLE
ncbi:hypothetical protein RJ41_14675, partial [Alteromonas marina]